MSSIGKQLAGARLARKLSIEDVAFQTRIPAGRLRDLENDDLSRFANLIYARGFLKIYSRFLDLDISVYLDQFNTSEFSHASGHEYVQTARATHNLPTAVFADYGRSRRPGLYFLITVVAGAVGFYLWSTRGDKAEGGQDGEVTLPNPPIGVSPQVRPAQEAGLPAEKKPAAAPPRAIPDPEVPPVAENAGIPAQTSTSVAPGNSSPPIKAEIVPEIEPEPEPSSPVRSN